uniref:Translationally-controlled tumor protein homolog n=3 Tax=Oryzias latipes TaxID=8090 RepID=A0A3P9LR46_ORYLA
MVHYHFWPPPPSSSKLCTWLSGVTSAGCKYGAQAHARSFSSPELFGAVGLVSVSGRSTTEAAKMIIYKCVISGDEMFSDIYKIKETEIFYEVEGKTVTRTEGFDDALIGANASAEEATETNESSTVSGVDIVLNHNLQETGFDKKGYLTYIKDYMKSIKAKLQESNPDRVEKFMAEAQVAVKGVVGNIKNYQFYTGESMNPEGTVGLLDYREDGITPYMLFFKDGLEIEKC